MKHTEPPQNLPVVATPPVLPEPSRTEAEPKEDVHFRDRTEEGTLRTALTESATHGEFSVPASRSLQPSDNDMRQRKERPIRALDDLLSVDDLAGRLLVSRSAVYRLVARRLISVYRLPGGIRFKVADVERFLEERRSESN